MVNPANIFGLLISLALLGYGLFGLMAGRISGSNIWNNYSKKDVTGSNAFGLSILWIIIGALGTVAYGGVMLGIKEALPLYNVMQSFWKHG